MVNAWVAEMCKITQQKVAMKNYGYNERNKWRNEIADIPSSISVAVLGSLGPGISGETIV